MRTYADVATDLYNVANHLFGLAAIIRAGDLAARAVGQPVGVPQCAGPPFEWFETPEEAAASTNTPGSTEAGDTPAALAEGAIKSGPTTTHHTTPPGSGGRAGAPRVIAAGNWRRGLEYACYTGGRLGAPATLDDLEHGPIIWSSGEPWWARNDLTIVVRDLVEDRESYDREPEPDPTTRSPLPPGVYGVGTTAGRHT